MFFPSRMPMAGIIGGITRCSHVSIKARACHAFLSRLFEWSYPRWLAAQDPFVIRQTPSAGVKVNGIMDSATYRLSAAINTAGSNDRDAVVC